MAWGQPPIVCFARGCTAAGMCLAEPHGAAMPIEALLPAEMATKAEDLGVWKVNLPATKTLVLGVLAGAFIALGAMLATVAGAGATGAQPFGVTRLIVGTAFSLGLVLVSVGGAELFTGNNLIVIAWMSGRIRGRMLARHWLLVYIGNFAGAVATAGLLFVSGQHTFGGNAVGASLMKTAAGKLAFGFPQAIALGVLCNALVCLAVWLSYSARSTTDRILAIVPPVAAFVAAGFEHSIANMYFLPAAWLIRRFGGADVLQAAGVAPADLAALEWGSIFVRNLLPVTLGNFVGGTVLVGAVYWFVYLRGRRSPP